MQSPRIVSLIVAPLCVIVLATAPIWSAPDDVEPVPAIAGQDDGFGNFKIADIERWIFEGSGTAEAGISRIQSQLKLKLDELNRVCALDATQKQKLSLAAAGDVKRFMEQVEEIRRKFAAIGRLDQQTYSEIWQDISPLQQKMASGIFSETSFYAKTVRTTLSAEQAAKYNAVTEERQRYRYRAAVEVALATLENTIPLRHDQHEALLKLVLEETKPPTTANQEVQAVMSQFSQIPDSKLKSILDERQLKMFKQRHQFQFRVGEAAVD